MTGIRSLTGLLYKHHNCDHGTMAECALDLLEVERLVKDGQLLRNPTVVLSPRYLSKLGCNSWELSSLRARDTSTGPGHGKRSVTSS